VVRVGIDQKTSSEQEFGQIAAALSGVPYMTADQGRRIFDHLRATGARDVLEIGTAYGVSASYMAAAVRPQGGHVTTLDREDLRHSSPAPEDVVARVDLQNIVSFVRVPDSSYTWWLKERVEERSDAAGNCEPLYDFCYLDGAHNWTIDGLSVILIEKLLRPGAWLLLDDLHWTYALGDAGDEERDLSLAERREPHMLAVFELLVRQHPNFSEFVEQDGKWGWAHKDPGGQRRYSVEVTSPLRSQLAVSGLRLVRKAAADLRLRRSSPSGAR
jgi:predicted O-methyltransferase YrrM